MRCGRRGVMSMRCVARCDVDVGSTTPGYGSPGSPPALVNRKARSRMSDTQPDEASRTAKRLGTKNPRAHRDRPPTRQKATEVRLFKD